MLSDENRGANLNETLKLRIMQCVSILALIGLAFGGLGLITNWTFFIPQSRDADTGQAAAESALDIMIFNADPTFIALGQKTNIIWTVSGATSVVIDPGIGSVSPAGKQTVSPDRTTTYTLVATNSTGSVTRTVTVGVNVPTAPPIITSFTASTNNITAGQPVTLRWSTRGAVEISLDNSIGPVQESGMQIVQPTSTTAYTLTAKNEGGPVKAVVTIYVPVTSQPEIQSFILSTENYTGTSCNITAGDPVVMSWNVLNANSVSINQGIGTVSSSGLMTIYPNALTTWTLMAANSFGAVTAYASCNVTTISLPVIGSFTLTPSTIKQGESATLKWSVSGQWDQANAVTINQDIGTVDAMGQIVVSPSVNTTYIIKVKNGQGTTSSSVALTVQPTTHPGINSFIATPYSIKAGSSATLQWNVTGATSVSVTPNVGIVAQVGNAKVSPAVTTVYTITASNSAGSITQYTTIAVTK